MSSESIGNETKEWDYLCPQFCDFNVTETTDQLKEIDHFFEIDHELGLEEQKSSYGEEAVPVSGTPLIESKLNSKVNQNNGSKDDDFTYETPPQNKENDDNEDNDVFYSTKKYLSIDRKYKLRSTPMRTLQYNGSTPFRETRISSKKKKKNPKCSSQLKKQGDSFLTMQALVEALPTGVPNDLDAITSTISESQEKEKKQNEERIETRIEIEDEVNNQVMTDQQNEQLIEGREPKQTENEVFESETQNCLQTEPEESSDPNKRESYVIRKVQKTVTVVSPVKSSTESTKKGFSNSIRRKGTPIRKSVLSLGRKVSSQSIVSRLYSTVKKCQYQYKSMAELLREFETRPRTDRSRSLDCGRHGSGQRSRSSSISSLTRPVSPKLYSIHRHRPTPRQTEDIIASQIKKYSFKANPIRKKLFDANAGVVPRTKSFKAPTKAIPMNFETEKRRQLWANKCSTIDNKPEADHKFKANPMPDFKNPKTCTKAEKKATTFKPFSFDDRIQHLVTKKRTHSEDNTKRIPSNNFKF